MFTQLFNLKRGLVPVTWFSPRDGEIRLVTVGDQPARDLPLAEYYEAHDACGQRMAERGPHADEPQP